MLDGVDNNTLISGIDKLMQEDPKGAKVSNSGGWQSQTLNIPHDDCIKSLLDNIARNVIDVFHHIKLHSEKFKISYWVNVNNKYNYNQSHDHIANNILYSGVYYVKVPSNSGGIVFENPRESFLTGVQFSDYNPENNARYTIPAKENELLLFSSDLKHFVEQNLTEDEDDRRISISFNIHN